MRHFCLLIFPVLFAISVFAQQHTHCGTDEKLQIFLAEDPEGYSLFEQAQHNALAALPEARANRSTSPTESCPDGIRIIPIYFHIMHNGGSASFAGDNNFTTAEIQIAVDNLNMHYAGNNPQLSRVQDQFWADGRVSSNTCIQFCWNPADIHRLNVSNAPHNVAMFTDTAGVVQNIIQLAKDAVSGASPSLNKCQYMNVYTGPYGIGQFGGGTTGYAWESVLIFCRGQN